MKIKKFIYTVCLATSLIGLVFPFGAAAEDICVGGEDFCEALSDNVKVDTRLGELFFGGARASVSQSIVPGGGVFGIKMKQKYVTVTDASGVPALSTGDIILSIDGRAVSCVNEVRDAVGASGGRSVTLRALHKGEELAIEVRPRLEDGVYKLGIGLRDGASGIGTITFYDPKTGVFGGLGHGICDADTGEVIPMESGSVCGVILGGVHKGESGKPGELSGILKENTLGTLEQNNDCGVFGRLTSNDIIPTADAIPIGTKEDIHEGEAKIISTLKNGKCAEYTVEIYDIDKSSDGSKSFRIRTSDKALLAISGGIVRGMSGSPIIQDGKLVGAVTHVMIANPTEGYGIFIENMLKYANNTLPKSAA